MKKLIYILLGFAVLSSCTERIDVELDQAEFDRYVIEGWVTDRLMQQEITISTTSDYFSNEPVPKVSGASVQVTDGVNVWEYTETEVGKYLSPVFQGEVGKEYNLMVELDGEVYEANSTMREVAPIDSMRIKYTDPLEEFGFDGDPWWDALLWTKELPGKGDAYMWLTYVNGVAIRDTLRTRSFSDDNLIDGSDIPGLSVDAIPICGIGPERYDQACPGDTIYVEQWNIGRDGYRVILGIMNETVWNGGLFDAPPANVETNLSNGALGFFGAASISSSSAIVPDN